MGELVASDGSRLRLLAEGDAGELQGLIEANRVYLAEWLPWAAGQTFEDTIDFIRRTRAQLDANDGFQAAIVSEGEIAGVVGYTGVDWVNRRTAIGYWLAEERRGRGTMTTAVEALADHALSAWELNRVEIRVAVGNRRSRAIPERLGFGEEATMRKLQRVGDRHLDLVVYAKVAEDPVVLQ